MAELEPGNLHQFRRDIDRNRLFRGIRYERKSKRWMVLAEITRVAKRGRWDLRGEIRMTVRAETRSEVGEVHFSTAMFQVASRA